MSDARNVRYPQRAHHRPTATVHDGYFTLKASAAVDVVRVSGVESIARTAAGLYTVTLSRPALDISGFTGQHQPAPGQACRFICPQTLTAATRVTEAKAGTFKIRAKQETGANTELSTGDVVWIAFTAEYSGADARLT